MEGPGEAEGRAPEDQPVAEAWKEVGKRFEQLGMSLAATVEAAWKNEDVRSQAEGMKSGLEALVAQVGAAIRGTAESEQVQLAAEETTRSVQTAGEATVQELRPHLISALHQLDQELQKLVRHLEADEQR